MRDASINRDRSFFHSCALSSTHSSLLKADETGIMDFFLFLLSYNKLEASIVKCNKNYGYAADTKKEPNEIDPTRFIVYSSILWKHVSMKLSSGSRCR